MEGVDAEPAHRVCAREMMMGDGGVKACSKGEEVGWFDGGGDTDGVACCSGRC